MQPLLSVIIPVYNISAYLNHCIDSLIIDNPNYEIILIDDGSTDSSAKICDEYASNYSYISVFHKENGGVSSARNLGIDVAKGKYIYFVDGDDYVSGFEHLLSYIEGNKAFAYLLSYKFFNESGVLTHFIPPDQKSITLNQYSSIKNRYFHALWGYVFDRNLIIDNAIRFVNDLRYAEDWCFVLSCLSLCETLYIIPSFCYFYRVGREGSALNTSLSKQQVLLHFAALDYISKVNAIEQAKTFVDKENNICFSYVLNIAKSHWNLFKFFEIESVLLKRLFVKFFFKLGLFSHIKFFISFWIIMIKDFFYSLGLVFREVYYFVRFFFHNVYYLVSNKSEIKSDVENFNYYLFGDSKLHSFSFLLAKYKEFRNLFYYRIPNKFISSFLKIWLKPLDSFYIVADSLGKSPMFFHSFSSILNAKSIGDNFVCRNGLTIGTKDNDNNLRPIIGDNVEVGANVVIIGNIKIGNNVIIGAGSVVVKDVPDNCVVAGNPAKIIKPL